MAHIEEVLGYTKEVERLKSVCDFLKNTEKYIRFDVQLPQALLILGDRGVGKTLMAEALANDCNREVFHAFAADLGVKGMKKMFKRARNSAPSIVLIDDIDYLDKEEDINTYERIVFELQRSKQGEVFCVITADDKEDLPAPFLAEIDADMMIELPSPTIEEACEIFKPIFDEKKMEKGFDISDFCYFAQGCSYPYAEETFHRAAQLAVYEGREKVSMRNLIRAGLLLKGDELGIEFDEATAYHEAGHAAAHLLMDGDAACIVLLENGGYFSEKSCKTKTYRDKERRYIVSVAGKACEEIFTGTSAIGSSFDLGRVSAAIEEDVKILASQGFEYFDSTELNSPAYNDALAKKVQSDLQKYYDRAKELIVQNRPLIEMIVEKLKDKFYLLHSEICEIYKKYKESIA